MIFELMSPSRGILCIFVPSLTGWDLISPGGPSWGAVGEIFSALFAESHR